MMAILKVYDFLAGAKSSEVQMQMQGHFYKKEAERQQVQD